MLILLVGILAFKALWSNIGARVCGDDFFVVLFAPGTFFISEWTNPDLTLGFEAVAQTILHFYKYKSTTRTTGAYTDVLTLLTCFLRREANSRRIKTSTRSFIIILRPSLAKPFVTCPSMP